MMRFASSHARMLCRVVLCAGLALFVAACDEEGDVTDVPDAQSEQQAPPAETPAPDPDPAPANSAPVLNGPPPSLSAKAGVLYAFTPEVTDADNDPLTFSISGLPAWATFDEQTGELSGTPGDVNVGMTDDIEITVSDGKAQTSIGPFRIQILARDTEPPPTNHPPTISGTPASVVTAGSPYIFVPTASDDDHDTLSFSISNRPRWARFDTSSGQLSGTPGRSQVGTTANIRIRVSDGKSTASLPPFSIQVQAPPNSAPTISGSPATSVQAGSAYTFQPSASDPDGQTLKWSIQNKPAWATFSTSTGKLSGTPDADDVGTTSNIVITVSDGEDSASLPAFAIEVTPGPNHAPTITGTPATSVTVGSAYSFTPSANDPDGNTLSFSIRNKPDWATFSIASGKLSGTPDASDVGTFSNIVISVSDGKASASLAAFSITVSGGSGGAASTNHAPAISGSPTTSVNVGTAYSFTPKATDSDGDTLSFSITNKPDWASFNTSTGRLSGTPGADDVGTTSNIVISVSDGKATDSLTAFSITVTEVTNGSATLHWTPPTQNADGSALTNLAGYRIYYGTSSSDLNKLVQIDNPGIASYTIEDLSPATWYFGVKAYTTAGTESEISNIASKTIN